MPEVQNVGAVDYAQYQPSQYPNDVYAEEYGNMPEVYDERMEEMKAASKSRLGATLLSGAVVAGLAYWGGHAFAKKAAKAEIEKAAEKAAELVKNHENKAKEAVKNYEKIQKACDEMQNTVKDLDSEADKVVDSKFGGFQYGKDFANKVKEAYKNMTKKAEEAKTAVKESAEKAAEKVEEKAKDGVEKAAEEATDAAKAIEEHATDANK